MKQISHFLYKHIHFIYINKIFNLFAIVYGIILYLLNYINTLDLAVEHLYFLPFISNWWKELSYNWISPNIWSIANNESKKIEEWRVEENFIVNCPYETSNILTAIIHCISLSSIVNSLVTILVLNIIITIIKLLYRLFKSGSLIVEYICLLLLLYLILPLCIIFLLEILEIKYFIIILLFMLLHLIFILPYLITSSSFIICDEALPEESISNTSLLEYNNITPLTEANLIFFTRFISDPEYDSDASLSENVSSHWPSMSKTQQLIDAIKRNSASNDCDSCTDFFNKSIHLEVDETAKILKLTLSFSLFIFTIVDFPIMDMNISEYDEFCKYLDWELSKNKDLPV